MISEDTERFKYCMGGHTGHRKVKNTVPHDVGDPGKWGCHGNIFGI